jgi:hypothetical protein
MFKLPFVLCALSVLADASIAQTPPTNRRIFPSPVTQTEPVIAVSPVNPNLLFASAVTINLANGRSSEGIYVSTNGGINWTGVDTCNGQNTANHGGDPGVMIHSDGRFVLTHIGIDPFNGMFSHYSTNLGQTWSNAFTLSNDLPEDKGGVAMDDRSSSPFYNRMYAAWARLTSSQPPLSFSYSTNAGTSWSAVSVINPSPPRRCSGGSIAVGATGTVYVAWAGMTAVTPFREDFAGFASSTNGGVSWNVRQNVYAMNGINGFLTTKGNIRVNGIPQIAVDNSAGVRSGWLYIVATEKDLSPAGSDPDLVLHRSTDGGQTWSAGIRVNQDPLNNGKIQYFPALAVDDNGGINILFYDDRNTAPDSAEVYLARSTDGGTTWTERVISDHRFKPKPIFGNYQGDHIALLAVGSVLHALWMDDASGIYQIWYATIDITVDVAGEPQTSPGRFALLQNYPNPFNPSTEIRLEIPVSGIVSLKVYTILGEEVATLMDGYQAAGFKSVRWDAGHMPGGIYFCRMVANNFVAVRKLVLVK